MNIERKTELGTIEIDEVTFSLMLRDAIALSDGRVHLASKEGKMLGGLDKKVSLSEAAQNMYIALKPVEYNGQEENNIKDNQKESLFWGFYVIIDFGTSIKEMSDIIFNSLEKNLKTMLPEIDGKLAMRVVGVKSKQIASRNLEITREYTIDE